MTGRAAVLRLKLWNWSGGMTEIRKARAEDRPIVEAFLDQLASALAADAVIFVEVDFGTVFDLFLTGERGVVLLAEDAEGVLGMASVSYNLGLRFGGE